MVQCLRLLSHLFLSEWFLCRAYHNSILAFSRWLYTTSHNNCLSQWRLKFFFPYQKTLYTFSLFHAIQSGDTFIHRLAQDFLLYLEAFEVFNTISRVGAVWSAYSLTDFRRMIGPIHVQAHSTPVSRPIRGVCDRTVCN